MKLKIVTKYILTEFLTTFLISFLFFFAIFFVNQILVNIKSLLEKSIPIGLVAMMMITFFPMIISYCLPFSIMLAVLMTMGRFSSDNEIIAFRALGFSYYKLFGPILICASLIGLVTLYVNDRLIPSSYIAQSKVLQKIAQIKPTMNFKSKTVKRYEDTSNAKEKKDKTIFTDIVNNDKINGLFIIENDKTNEKRIITAKSAEMVSDKNKKGILEIKMHDTMVQFETADRPNEFNFGYSQEMSYFINFQDIEITDPKNVYPYYKTTYENYKSASKYKILDMKDKNNKRDSINIAKEDINNAEYKNEFYVNEKLDYNTLLNNIKSIDAGLAKVLKDMQILKNDKNSALNVSLMEFYRKFTNPIACLVFTIFAAPIGIYSRRAGFQIGFILGLFLTAFYWFSFSGSILMGRKFILTPFISMAMPNLFFFIIGSIFLFKRLKE